MALLLTDIVQQVAIDLGQHEAFTATGGSATTTVNTNWNILDDPPEEESIKGKYIVITKDAGGAGASPQGRWALISSYAVDTYTITHATVTDAVASGDECLLVSQSVFPFLDIVKAVNKGLYDVGWATFVDRSLTTAANQTEYSLPANVIEVVDVRIQGITTDANDNQYYSITDWKVIPPTTTLSTAPLLYIPQYLAGYTIEIWYNGYHPELTAYSDIIQKYISKPLLVAATKAALLESYINKNGSKVDQSWKNMYSEAVQQRDILKQEQPIMKHKRKKLGLLWTSPYDNDRLNITPV